MEAIPTLEQFENDMKKEGIVPKNSDTKNKPQLSKNNGIKEEENQPKIERKKPSSLKEEIKMEAIPTLEQFENDMKKEGIVPKNSDTKNKPQLSKNNGIKEEEKQPKIER